LAACRRALVDRIAVTTVAFLRVTDVPTERRTLSWVR
jgi:hypothetical protein